MVVSRIILIRHGRSAHLTNGAWLSREDVFRWRDAYDQAGIAQEDAPPASLVDAVALCETIVSSDLPRALESAALLAPGRSVITSPLLREAPPAIPDLPVRLPLLLWNTLITISWSLRVLQRRDASQEDLQRAADAVTWLESLSPPAATLAIVTHGVFRRLLTNQLARSGWNVQTARRSYRWWSVWTADRGRVG
jgi:broad specificity phosphatase PhoE